MLEDKIKTVLIEYTIQLLKMDTGQYAKELEGVIDKQVAKLNKLFADEVKK